MCFRTAFCVGSLAVALHVASWSMAQVPGTSSKPAETPATVAGRPVVIERAPVLFRDPAKYQVNLHLEPTRKITLAASTDGVVSSLLAPLGQEVAAQGEVLRLDSRVTQLKVQRAAAALKAAKDDVEAGTKGGAEARVKVAEADLALAELEQNLSGIRSPFKGIVIVIHVVEGEFIHAGQPLATVIDPTQFVIEAPIDGRANKAGDPIEIQVEEEAVSAKLSVVLPLVPALDPLRELFPSPATGRIILDNPNGKWRAGQTVYSPLIPRLPVAEVPTASLQNLEQGGRKVQVIREGFVRDVPVRLLGQLGPDYQFVSGRFAPTDELVLRSSETIVDGARVMPRDPHAPAAESTSPPKGKPAPPVRQPTGSNF